MPRDAFSNEQVMLTLSYLSYRGFWSLRRHHQAEVAAMIRRGLAELEPVKGDWEMVWGPGTFRYLGSLLDDALMYVVRHREQRDRYTVVVRGTNAISAGDWVFGDFLAARQIPWRPAGREHTPGAALSLSSALGLRILLGMRAPSSHRPPWYGLVPSPVRSLLSFGWDRALDLAQLAMQGRERVLTLRIAGRALDGLHDDLKALKASLRARSSEEVLVVRRRLLQGLDQLLDLLGDGLLDLLEPLLWRQTQIGAAMRQGQTLEEFLRDAVKEAEGPVEINFTGHSKGGALSPTLALHLADTRDVGQGWDPEGRATLHCYPFAGPTAGNAAFAAHYDATLGASTHRLANHLDMVVHAWLPEEIRAMPKLYGATTKPPPGLQKLANAVAEDMEALDYRQIGNRVTMFPGTVDPRYRDFVAQEIHQHVQAYLDALDLNDVLSLSDFAGLHLHPRGSGHESPGRSPAPGPESEPA